MRLEYNSTVYKNLLYPALGTLRPHQAGYFNFMSSVSKIRGYIENVFFPLRKSSNSVKKEIFNKSTPIKILIARQGNNKAAQSHKIRSAVFYLRDQFPLYKDRFNESLSLES